jgi:ATP-binding cassette subfamily B protein
LDNEITTKLQKSEIEQAKKLEWLTFKIDSIRSIISIIVFIAMISLLGWGYMVGRLTLGDFSFVTATCFYIRRSVWIASVNLLNLFKGIGIAKESFNDLIYSGIETEQFSEINEHGNNDNYSINFRSICFGYDEKHTLFNKLSLHIPEGQKVIIKGKSGSGKTTLMQLILNFFPLKHGQILIGNKGIESPLKNNIVYIPQHTELFHRSVIDNILYSAPQESKEEINKVLRLAEVDEFILSLDNGYNTLVGENGVKLSGGQCQRVAIARALLKKPAILILDEATSALDNIMEKNILRNIINHDDIKTLIMVTHNQTNSKLFDRILSFENGVIIDDKNLD